MAWKLKEGYSAPDLEKIKESMNGINIPAVNGTYLAMKPIVFEGKAPFHSASGTGETATTAPLTPAQARRAFALGWVHDDNVAAVVPIAEKDGDEFLADI